jgi:hypothetical protein
MAKSGQPHTKADEGGKRPDDSKKPSTTPSKAAGEAAATPANKSAKNSDGGKQR